MGEPIREHLDALKEWIADLLAHGCSDKEIADELDSTSTLLKLGFVAKERDLIAVIRDLMTERKPHGGD